MLLNHVLACATKSRELGGDNTWPMPFSRVEMPERPQTPPSAVRPRSLWLPLPTHAHPQGKRASALRAMEKSLPLLLSERDASQTVCSLAIQMPTSLPKKQSI